MVPANYDKIEKVKEVMDDVINQMHENIHEAIERGENIDIVMDITEELKDNSFQFKKSSGEARKLAFWNYVKVAYDSNSSARPPSISPDP